MKRMELAAKKKLLLAIPSGLYVIGLKSGEEYHGFTASWLSQISFKPPCVVLGVRHESKSLEMMKSGKAFTVNYFSKENKKVIESFFKPVPKEHQRLGSFPYDVHKTGAPVIKDALGFLECEVRKISDGFGDHAAVIGEVVGAHIEHDIKPIILSDTRWLYGG